MVQRIGVRVEYKVHRLAEGNKNNRKTNEEIWHVTPYSCGVWTLALIGAMIGTNEPSIAPILLIDCLFGNTYNYASHGRYTWQNKMWQYNSNHNK